MRKSTRSLLALAATVSMTAAACGSDSDTADSVVPDVTTENTDVAATDVPATDVVETDVPATDAPTTDAPADSTDSTDAPAEEGAAAVDDGASVLRSTMTSLLQEHVYLTGGVVETAVDAAGDLTDVETVAAIAALDENTVALADAVGSVVGPEQGDAFLELWRQHIGFFVDYTLGKATNDQAAVDEALTNLEGYQDAAGEFFSSNTGGAIVKEELVEGLAMHVTTLTAAIDAMVADTPDQFELLQAAAMHMDDASLLLTTGIVKALPDMFPGAVDSEPSVVRNTLTYQLQEHVYLAGAALEQAIDNGGDLTVPNVAAAVEVLDGNTVRLSETVASVAGEEKGEAFKELWRQHIGFFVDYTLGKATADQEMVDQALTDLMGYQEAAGAFFDEISGGAIDPADLVPGLEEHVATLTAAIDAMVESDPSAFTKLRVAGQHMPMAALLLATGIVEATS